ncbi:hypothetical protein [Streptomyces sp. JV184]|uniref:hypothetical protein n=1 Tax=Streptomyces sp. JV184 TaxID=858637 RepID=UPI002E764E0C|nr:hypothetical protein [Streptomyces sp. JV184]MEE1744069.1 hypothetical protein [Streptomyces sp. JV184]
MSRIGILAGPYPVDDQLGGIGLRLWEIAQVLADAGHQVTICAPRASDFSHPGVSIVAGREEEVAASSDAVVTTDLPNAQVLLAAYEHGTFLVAENAPPIEHLHFDSFAGPDADALYRDTVARWRLQLLLSDHLLVRSEAERASTLGALVAAGRMSAAHHRVGADLASLVSLVPIGYNRHSLRTADTAAARTGAECELLWNGGVWDYCRPDPVLHALAADPTSAFRLRLLYAPPPDRLEGLLARADDLGMADRVLLPEAPVAHRARDGWVKAARAVVITGERTAENMTCHRLRLRDAALYRLPVVVDGYGATGDLVAALGIGPVVDPNYPQALAAALRHAACDGPERDGYLDALDTARSPRRGRFALERHLAPLLGLLESGHRAPDRTDRHHQDAIHTLLTCHPGLREQAPAVI